MKAALQEFINYMSEVKKASANTIMSYQNDLIKLIRYLNSLNITETGKINETSLNSYILNMEREGMSPATVSRNIASIKAFVLYMIKKGIIQEDPSERMRAPKVEKKAPHTLTTDQVNDLLNQPDTDTLKGIRDKAMLELLYATGIRVSELIAIKIEDIHLKGKFIRCCNGNKERMIPFGTMAKQALEKYLKQTRGELLGAIETNYCFTNLSGEPMSRQGFWKIIKGYGRSAGIQDDITPQVLRNSFAVHMMENGADLKSLQEFMGHSDISTTQLYMQNRTRKITEVYAQSHPRANLEL
ncbi:tyrosine recombinase XerD [Anaerocolumna cellulosilytica]|uniref:Tyrosine recombinase XerC n=1 Tax=Anaerocolumna cellulosilytica TaxID=433286 RepID=A0A6S6R1V6_9FIRM|nr:site-specific tyrosine recombinase [Anaerocolumna cellulosilytica]MBB5197106.1 integrase/recombinase XerD [Anaerocolumna cellulosilytica]BCJ95319.1 tyrosine recombinase XerD [Anaerocolumna cellulosilytica]